MYVKTNLMLRLPVELHQAVLDRASKAGMSMNQWVNLTLAAAILRESDQITETRTTETRYTL